MHHGRLEVLAFCVLPLSLVRVLVAPEGLGGREVPAAVVAFKSPAALASAFAAFVVAVGDGGGVDVVLFCGGVFAGIGVVEGFGVFRGGVCAEFYAKEADALLFVDGRGRADEGELRE